MDLAALLISLFSLLVALAAGGYAGMSAFAAKRQNEISIHEKRLEIFRSLQSFRAILATRGVDFPEEEYWKFLSSADLSEFYFNEEIYKKFMCIADGANATLNKHSSWAASEIHKSPDYSRLVEETKTLHRTTRDKCEPLIESLKETLRLAN